MANIQDVFKEVKKNYDRVNEIRWSVTTVAKALRDMVNESKGEIERDISLSAEGKRLKIQDVQKHFGKQFVKQAAKMKDEFQKSVVKVRFNADRLANEAGFVYRYREFAFLKYNIV